MALPPTIPTSFVPKMPVSTTAHKRAGGPNPFLALAYFILGLVLLAASAVFGYQVYLEGVEKKKANDVATAQQNIDQATVTQFIRLRDRFTAAKGILDHHVALSQFFNVLEANTLQGVTFKRLSIMVRDDKPTEITLAGTARTLNTLAAQSAAFAADKRIKRAIFSAITTDTTAVGASTAINFELRAELDPTLVPEQIASATPAPATPAPAILAPVASSTATTTP